MRNLENTEKSLKHWLKNKVTITTATVVGFLIMGTVSFGAETHHVTKTETLSTSIEVIKDGEAKAVYVDKEGNNAIITNNTSITANGGGETHGIQGNHEVNFNVVNEANGKISSTSANGKAFGIQANGKAEITNKGTISAISNGKNGATNGDDTARGIVLNKGGKITNSGTILAQAINVVGVDADGETVFTNEDDGKITVTGGKEFAYGVRLNGEGTGVNNGTIEVTSEGMAQGVNINVSSNVNITKPIFENNGTIKSTSKDTNGKMAYGIYVSNPSNKKVSVVNNENGIIEVKSANGSSTRFGVAVKLNQGTGKPGEIGLGNINFENKGNVSIENGVALDLGNNSGVNSETGTITVKGQNGLGVLTAGNFDNFGNLNVESNYGTGIKAVSGKITNDGTIAITGDENTYGVELFGQNATLLNTNKIIVTNNNNKEGTSGLAYGVKLENGATATNSGNIDVTSPDRAVGVDIYLDKDYKGNTEKLFVNEKGGTITANSTNGATANAISVTNKSNQKVTIENNGTLISNGKNGTNTANGKPLYNPVVNLAGQNVEFTNNGTIVAGDGVGIAVNGSNSNLSATNNGTIKVNSTGKAVISYGTATNNGVIQITDKTAQELKNENFNANSLFTGNVTGDGMVADKEGYAVNATHDNTIAGIKVTTGELNKYTGNVFFGEHKGSTIIGDETPTTNINTLNIIGKVAIENGQNPDGAKLAVDTLNFDANGQFNVGAGNTLVLGDKDKNITVNATETQSKEDRYVITLENGAELGLENATINKGANISGDGTVSATGETTINSNVTSKEFEVFDGNVLFNGVLSSDTVTVEKVKKDTKLTLSSGASFGKATTLNTTNGTTVFEIGAKGENALANSKGTVTVTGNIDFDTNNLTTNTTVKLNNEKENIKHDLSKAEYQDKTDEVYNTHLDKDKNTLEFAYNKALYNNTPELNGLNNIMQGLNDKLSQNVTERANQLDEIYAGNIYSETVRAGYDNIKLNEETVLSLGKTAKAGELKTHGKALYTKDEYTRNGALNNFDADVETTGLFAGAEYGLSDTMSVGAVFSGAKQDVNVSNGSADGDLFYLGVYGTKVVGNYDFTAGLGYQLGKYDADYNMAKGLTASEKYDSNAVNGYVQGRYTANLGDGLSVQPKVKLGYIYIEQDDVNDNNYKVSDAEVSTFDTEVGVDVVKSVQFEKSKLDVKFGTSYIKAMGDTDKKFTLSTKDGSAEILGAELAENTLKFALDAEVENENGFFYNAGVNYRFGSEDTEAYSVNAGVGYKF